MPAERHGGNLTKSGSESAGIGVLQNSTPSVNCALNYTSLRTSVQQLLKKQSLQPSVENLRGYDGNTTGIPSICLLRSSREFFHNSSLTAPVIVADERV